MVGPKPNHLTASKAMNSTYLTFLLSQLTVVVVTLRVWFHGPAGEEVTHCIVANVLRYLAKLEKIPGDRREGGRRKGGEEEREGEKGGGREERREERREEGERREKEEERREKGGG